MIRSLEDIRSFRAKLARHPRIPNTPPGIVICDTVDCSLLEHYTSPLEVKGCKAGDRAVSRYVTTWGLPPDEMGDIIDRGATRRMVKFWEGGEKKMPLFDGHDTSSVRAIVGFAEKFKEDAIGLWVRFQILKGQTGDEIFERVKARVVDAFSIGFMTNDLRRPTEAEKVAGAARVITGLDLREVSLVPYPANRRALVDRIQEARADQPLWSTDPSRLPLPERIDLLKRRNLAIQLDQVLNRGGGEA